MLKFTFARRIPLGYQSTGECENEFWKYSARSCKLVRTIPRALSFRKFMGAEVAELVDAQRSGRCGH